MRQKLRTWVIAASLLPVCVVDAFAVDPDRVAASAANEFVPPSPTAFMDRYERVERELTRLGDPSPITGMRPALLPLISDAQLHSTNVNDASGVRYCSLRLTLLNQGPGTVALKTSRISLSVEGRSYSLKDVPADLRSYVVDFAGRPTIVNEILPPEDLSIPPMETAAIPLFFAPIESRNPSPKLELRYEFNGTTVEVDLNRFQRGLLELQVERIGPEQACVLVTIGGELDGINATDVAEQLTRVAEQGMRRCVITWKSKAEIPSTIALGWLGNMGATESAFYSQLPALPVEFKEVHLAALPKGSVYEPTDETQVLVHAELEDAVAAALATIFPRQSRQVVLRELMRGHAAVKAAALRFGSSKLAADDIPLIARSVNAPSALLRIAACRALSEFDDARAREILKEQVLSGPPGAATAALEALVSSRFPANIEAAVDLTQDLRSISEEDLLKIIVKHPRREFRDRMLEAARHGKVEARVTALGAIRVFRGTQLRSIFEQALEANEPAVRDAAFKQLVAAVMEDDTELRPLVIEEALERLAADPNNADARAVIHLTRDRRVVPILASHLSDESADQGRLLDLIGRVGGPEAIETIVAHYPRLKPPERAEALRHLWVQQAPEAVRFAFDDLNSTHPDLMKRCVDILAHDASSAAVRAIANELSTRKAQDGYVLATALATISSPEAVDALLEFRDSPQRILREYAYYAFKQIWERSAATEAVANAKTMLNLAGQPSAEMFQPALDYATTAIEIDPRYPPGYSIRGNILLRQGKWAEAVRDFRASLELNPDDDMSVTGVAIGLVMVGQREEAFEWIEPLMSTYADRDVFFYNCACVYGRALEQLLKEPQTAESTRQAEEYRRRAFDLLGKSVEKAIDVGVNQAELMQNDPDLEALKDRPEFADLLKRAAVTPN